MKLFAIALALLLGALGARSITHAQSSSCKGPDSISAPLLESVRTMMVPGDSLRLHMQLPLVSTAEVQLVQTDSICIRAQFALDTLILSTSSNPHDLGTRALYVISIGSYYGVHDPGSRAGEWVPLEFFSPTWTHLGGILAF